MLVTIVHPIGLLALVGLRYNLRILFRNWIMKNSMRDQLLRAGVASKKQAQKVSAEQRKKQKQARKNRQPAASGGDAYKRQQSEQAARDRELNRKKQAEIERRAIAAQIRQLIEMNRLSIDDGETPFNFADGKIVRKLYVTDDVQRQLGRGRLSIVRLGDGYAIVPTVVAQKISERDASVVVPLQQTEAASDDDELYADYAVPDDLMW